MTRKKKQTNTKYKAQSSKKPTQKRAFLGLLALGLFLDPEFLLRVPEIQRVLVPVVFISHHEYLGHHLHISSLPWKRPLRNEEDHRLP